MNLSCRMVAWDQKAFVHCRHVSPQFIVEYVDTLHKELGLRQYFFTEIVEAGLKVYDTKEFKPAKAQNYLPRK